VVISIIGLLASVVLTSLNTARVKARDAKRKSDIHQIKLAIELYYDSNNGYPPVSCGNDCQASMGNLQDTISPVYISAAPHDPSLGSGWDDYYYVRATGGQGYGLRVNYENSGVCKTGMNVSPGWWGAGVPICP